MRKYLYEYYRISLDDENAIESNSITNQRHLVKSHISTISELADMPTKELVDDGHTGTNFNRPGITQLLDAARRGEVACIVVKDLSRFGRKFLEVSKYLEQLFPYLGIRFIAVGDNYDSDTHKGTTANLDVPVRNMLNALYSKNVSKNVKSAKQTQTQQGKYINAFAPYGFKKDPTDKHRIIIDEPAAAVVRRIFELTCEGKRPKQIADTFNAEGVLTPSSYKKKNGSKLKIMGITNSVWSNSTIVYLLRDERYKGTFIGGKIEAGELGTDKRIYKPKNEWIRIPNSHPAIITQEMWDTAVLKRGTNSGRDGKPNIERMLYKRVRCGYCGHVLRYRTESNHNYYVCKTPGYTNEYGCPSTSYVEHEIVNAVKKVVCSHITIMLDLKKLSETMKNVSTKGISTVHITIEELDGEIKQLKTSKRTLYERYKKGSLDTAEYLKVREATENKITIKTAERETLTAHNNIQTDAVNSANFFFDSFVGLQDGGEPSAEVVNVLVKSVHIFSKHRIEICFSFADKLEKALQSLNQGL